MIISPENSCLRYMGRIDRSDRNAPRFYYAGSCVILRFKGTELGAVINNKTAWGNLSLGAVIDGEIYKAPLDPANDGADTSLVLAENLPDKEHTAAIYKMHAANHAFTLKGIDIGGELLPPPEAPELKIEAYGDSVCAGEVIEALDYVGKCDPENHNSVYDNVWNSFVMQTARKLNAQIHNICQGGIALFNGTGYFHAPDFIGLESTYDKLCYFPEGGGLTEWDFAEYIPDIVIIAVGQNDNHDGINDRTDINISDPVYREKWKTGYKKLVRTLNGKYNAPKFVLTTTVLMHDPDWDNAIEEIKDELNAEGIKAYHNMFSRNGAATPGHPRLPEHDEMARELTNFIGTQVM